MYRFNIVTLAMDIVKRGEVSASDVLTLRQSVFGDGRVWPDEAMALFDLMQKRLPACEEWPGFFAEAMSDYLVNQIEPYGYADKANARWLIAMINRDEQLWGDTELETLLQVMEKSISRPQFLEDFVLECVRKSVIEGRGLTRRGMQLEPGCVKAGEVDVLRHALYAAGGPGNVGIDRREAEALFDINDATLNGANDPQWRDLFVKAIANHVMTVSGYQPPSREEALRRERWLDDANVDVAGFFGRMVAGWSSVLAAYTAPNEQRLADVLAHEGEKIDASEAAWLRERIMRNGHACENQKALLAFLKAGAREIHPALGELIAQPA